MGKISEYAAVSAINPTGYLLGIQDGATARFPATTFKGAPGDDGATGEAGVNGYTLTDNSGATSDLLLVPSEAAYITYSAATSVPLHIQLEEGIYDFFLCGEVDATIGTLGYVNLLPNNTTVTAGDIDEVDIHATFNSNNNTTTLTSGVDATGRTAFALGYALLVRAEFRISTFIKSKHIAGNCMRRQTATGFYFTPTLNNWLDTTTVWSSLGTIEFPFAQSGVIFIRRLL